ncbi:hypothetical protein BCR35DRAFT_308453 [Leucosporidium creatinivorum]|uniref:Uncharacterized protein n=1 Tax=Leucosporidium creatinivorum TaxID=106004 RepID=A0A1Y2E5F2_9BASI|nr:hypothetical protein BCR35DRAFT_308453 [Leucosporidium creatinivorum]
MKREGLGAVDGSSSFLSFGLGKMERRERSRMGEQLPPLAEVRSGGRLTPLDVGRGGAGAVGRTHGRGGEGAVV